MLARLRSAGLVVVLLFVVVYVGDYMAVRYRIPNDREPFGTVQVKSYYAVRLKNRKTEIMPAEPEDEVCVHSLFPHFGHNPCWYVERHREKRIDVGFGNGNIPGRAHGNTQETAGGSGDGAQTRE